MPELITETNWIWPHFSFEKMSCDGECRMDPDFMDLLEKIRSEYGKPLVETSGYRTPKHNASVSHTGDKGPHTTGRAIDIAIGGENAFLLASIAISCGITGLGISQKGPSRFIHLDNLTKDDGFPRPMIWSY